MLLPFPAYGDASTAFGASGPYMGASPEVDSSARLGAAPRIMTGEATRPAGRLLLKFGGGYILPPEAYTLLGEAGVNTVVQIG